MAKPVDQPIEYDPDFKGPLDKRSCTDILCLLIFVGAVAGWVFVALFAFKNGDSRLLLVPKDSEGRRCGVDSGLQDKPYLLFFDLIQCASISAITGCPTTQMCVKECPTETFIFNEDADFKSNRDKLICKPHVNKDDFNSNKDIKSAIDKNLCARWYLPSLQVKTPAELSKHLENTVVNDLLKNVYKRCIPKPGKNLTNEVIETIVNGADSGKFWKAIANVKELNELSEVTHKIFEDLKNARWHIFFGLVAGMLICLLYITILRFTVSLIVWTSLFGVIAGLAYGFTLSFMQYLAIRNKPPPDVPLGTDETTIESILAAKNTWVILSWTTGIAWVIIVLLTWFLRRRIRLAIALIEEGSKAISSMRITLCFPILPWVGQMVILIIGIACFMYITTVGDLRFVVRGQINTVNALCICDPGMNYKEGSACTVEGFNAACHQKNNVSAICDTASCYYSGVLSTGNTKFLHGVNIVVCLWSLFFLSAMGEMILAGTFATWYWTFDKRDVPFFSLSKSIYRTFRYHLGTIAFGSLIITICRLIRLTLEYINAKLKKYDNGFVRAIMWCMRCFFYCLEKFLKFINRNAYVMCAIHGKNFCASAKDAFFLLVRNALRVFVLDKVTDFIFFIGKLFLTAIVCYSAYFVFDKYPTKVHFPEVNYLLTPVVIIGFGTYCIASLFFVVYEMAVDTLFLCFLEDSERNDGSQSKPYYMSKNLMKILNKHNKTL